MNSALVFQSLINWSAVHPSPHHPSSPAAVAPRAQQGGRSLSGSSPWASTAQHVLCTLWRTRRPRRQKGR